MKLKVLSAELNTYVFFFYDNVTQNDAAEPQRVASRSIKNLTIPRNAFAFQFFDMVEVVVQFGRQTIRLRHRLKLKDSKTFHYGDAMSLATAKRQFRKELQRLPLLQKPGSQRVFRTILGHWYPLEPGDVVIKPQRRRS